MRLPNNKDLSISKLSAVFRNTSATYKFYWFWALIEAIESGKTEIDKKEIFARMISLSWYTVNYFKVSFGKQDLLQKAISDIKVIEAMPIDCKKAEIIRALKSSDNSVINKTLYHFDLNVPHKFLSPWLGSGSKKAVYKASQEYKNDCIYALFNDKIIVSENWKTYLLNNAGVIKAFIFWHLSLFLQNKNPNVPNIPNKIIKPATRGSLALHKTKYWDIVIKELGGIDCIYTGKKLYQKGYAVEHFLPYQFLTHDLMWNLIPADGGFNSSKSDKLPPLDTYFDKFYDIQKIGFEIIKDKSKKNKFLEDYLSIFPELEIEKAKYKEYLVPLFTIAHNNGFSYL